MTFARKMVQRSAGDAWWFSAAIALSIPVLLWILYFTVVADSHSGRGLGLLMTLVISVPIHLLGHALFGIPAIKVFWSRPRSAIWKFPVSACIGVAFASAGLFLSGIIFNGPKLSNFQLNEDFIFIAVVYGLASSIAAWLVKPNRQSEQDRDANGDSR